MNKDNISFLIGLLGYIIIILSIIFIWKIPFILGLLMVCIGRIIDESEIVDDEGNSDSEL